MRILIVSNYYPPFEIGGWEQNAREVTVRLSKNGHHVHVLTSNYQREKLNETETNITRALHLQSPDYVHYHPHYTLLYPWREHQNHTVLEKCVKDFKPDVLFIWGMWNLSTTVARHAERLCPGRVVYYIASFWPMEQDAHSAFWMSDDGDTWRHPFKRLAGQILAKSMKFPALRNQLDFKLVLCVSEYIRNFLINGAGIPRSQILVVHNGIEPANFPVRVSSGRSTTGRLIYTGRLSFDKGVHTAVEALGLLQRAHPDLQLELTIVGAGAPDYEAKLRNIVEAMELSEHVKFIGRVPREEIPDILVKHDIFLFPSIWPEPIARSIQEAMACGLVVIGTTTGGTPEILQDGINGLTYKAGDPQMLADKIVQVTKDQELILKISRAGRQTVEERFTLDRMVDEIEFHLGSITKISA